MTVQQLCPRHLTECKAKSEMFIRKLFLYSAPLMSWISFYLKVCTKFQLVKYFFASLNNLAASFTQSTWRTKVLDEFLQRRLPHVCPTRWNNATRLVNTVYKKLDDLRLVFDLMLDNAIDIPSAVLTPISGHLANLENFKIFAFTWLCSTKFILWPMFFFIPSEIVVWHFKLLEENWPHLAKNSGVKKWFWHFLRSYRAWRWNT